MATKISALFLDRDGTLIEDRGYLHVPQEVHLLPGVKACLRTMHQRGTLFFLFSNQSGVGRGFFTMEDVEACNQQMLKLIGLGSYLFTRVCLPISTPDRPCAYRKPSPKFILECLQAYQLSPQQCWMIGDKESDMQAGQAAHINTIFIHPKPHSPWITCKDFTVIQQVLEAVENK